MSILVIWAAATVVALAAATWTAYGPVVLILTRTHGVHLGDLGAAVGAYGAAALMTDRVRRQGRTVTGGP